jgi:hypothetical protein
MIFYNPKGLKYLTWADQDGDLVEQWEWGEGAWTDSDPRPKRLCVWIRRNLRAGLRPVLCQV